MNDLKNSIDDFNDATLRITKVAWFDTHLQSTYLQIQLTVRSVIVIQKYNSWHNPSQYLLMFRRQSRKWGGSTQLPEIISFKHTIKYQSCRMTRFPQGAAGEQVFPQRRLQGSFVMLKTHTTSQIPFSGSPSNWVEGFNYNHLRKNKYPFSTSLPHYTPLHSLEQTDSSFHWFHSTLKIRLSPPTSPPKWSWLPIRRNRAVCDLSNVKAARLGKWKEKWLSADHSAVSLHFLWSTPIISE